MLNDRTHRRNVKALAPVTPTIDRAKEFANLGSEPVFISTLSALLWIAKNDDLKSFESEFSAKISCLMVESMCVELKEFFIEGGESNDREIGWSFEKCV